MEDEKNKGGRPRFEDRSQIRSKLIAIRVTEASHAELNAQAEAVGMCVADYVRGVLKGLSEGTIRPA